LAHCNLERSPVVFTGGLTVGAAHNSGLEDVWLSRYSLPWWVTVLYISFSFEWRWVTLLLRFVNCIILMGLNLDLVLQSLILKELNSPVWGKKG